MTPERDVALGDWDSQTGSVTLRPLLARDMPGLIGEDGSHPVAITAPTWSPDGSLMAASLIYRASAHQPRSALVVVDVATGAVSLIFQGTPGLAAFIAPGLPHYVNWAPDCRHLALLAQTSAGMTLFVLDRLGLSPAAPVISGAPLFFAWSPSGDALLVHRAGDLILAPASLPESPSILMRGGLACQLPAWSGSGDVLAIARHESGGIALGTLQRDGTEKQVRHLAAVGATMRWRPGTEHLAYSLRALDEPGPGRGLWLTTVDGAQPEKLTDLPIDAYYWSADGSKLAILSTTPETGLCFWSVIEIQTGAGQRFTQFYRSAELALMLGFFEQYVTSHRPWSAAGDALLVTGRVPNNGTPPETNGSSIYIQPAESGSHPGFAAQGTFASWCPVGSAT